MDNTAKRQYTIFERLFLWRRMKFSEHKFILLLSFIVGIFTALAGLVLKRTAESFAQFFCKHSFFDCKYKI